MRKEHRNLLLRVVGTALLLAAIGWLIDLREAFATLRQMTLVAMVAVVVLSVISWSVGILKWKLVLQSVTLRELAKFYFIGMFYGLVLPGQLAGEAVKTVRLASGHGLGRVGASVLLDRLTGMIGLGIVSGAGLLLSRSYNALFQVMGTLICLVTIAFTLVLFAIRAPWVLRLAIRFSLWLKARGGWLRKAGAATRRFASVWRTHARDVRLMTTSVMVGVIFQLLNVAIVWVIAWGIGVPLSFGDAAWSLGIVLVATLLPIAFGGFGVRELSFVAVLGLIGVPAAQALSISIACSLVTLLGALPGVFFELGWLEGPEVSARLRRRTSHA